MRTNNRQRRSDATKRTRNARRERVRDKAPARAPRRRPNVLASLGKAIGTAGGAYFGGPAGSMAGGALGHIAGSFIGDVTGLGSYKIQSNALLGTGISVRNRNTHPNSVVIRDREYISDVTSSATAGQFSLSSYPINPGMLVTFPKLSQIAANYEEYALEGVIFEFRSLSGDALNSVNTTLGTVILATSYNADASLFSSKAEMESTMFVNSGKPSISYIHPIECSPDQSVLSELYIRNGAVADSKKTYDLGTFQVATTGLQGVSVVVGELWVSYQVALLKPRLFSALGNANEFNSYNSALPTGAAPLGTLAINSEQMPPAFPPTSSVYYFPRSPLAQTYEINYIIQGTAAVIAAPTYTLANGASLVLGKGGDNSSWSSPNNGATSTAFNWTSFVTVLPNMPSATANAASLTFGTAGTLPSAATFFRFDVVQVANKVQGSL